MNLLTRRAFISAATWSAVGVSMPRVLLASAPTDARFVFVMLRGALDGLAAMAPYGDGNYASKRGELALSIGGGAHKLDGLFALHPSLVKLHQRFNAGELVAFHAVASPYRDRSHFDGQDLLENGTLRPHGANDGWLNRSLASLQFGKSESEKFAMAFAQNVPLILRGSTQVGSWAPSRLPDTDVETLQRIADMYAGNEYFSSRLQAAVAADSMAAESGMNVTSGGRRDPLGSVNVIAGAAGRMMKSKEGARIAVIELTGWDTHANQGAERGLLATRLAGLDNAIDTLRVELGDAWKRTAVLIATEFGRTVAINGTRGTDHGTGTCAFLVGGAVNGGRISADWPGLANENLYQGRDLYPTVDLRSICKSVLADHIGIAEAQLETRIFPESRGAKRIDGLIRSS
jgi:uncharacterized protein (DUF1501 family)